ncbi:MAG: hydrogenase small subunit [Candidatus Bipolaricaulota bacterium]|nr:MAG: hydrogenase small subunit [Candidatus Bipolaricaulota bacterium]
MPSAQEVPVLWLQTATCSGCSVSVLNSSAPRISDLLLQEVLPGRHVNLRFQATIMAGSGEAVLDVLEGTQRELPGGYVLVVEGSIPTTDGGIYGTLGEEPMVDRVLALAADASAVVALGTCASFGGIFAAGPNPTGCVSVTRLFEGRDLAAPVVNIPGCPPHPDWFVGTVATLLLLGAEALELDEFGRPRRFFGRLIHENCPRRAYFDEGKFAKKLSDEGCLYEMGCKGTVTHADCPLRRWNDGTNWVIGSGAPCNGCTEPEFPDLISPMYERLPEEALLVPRKES